MKGSDYMYRSYKFRLYPDKEQKILLNKYFGNSRFIYNHYLYNNKNNGYQNAYSNISDYVNNLKYQYPFLQESDSILIRKTLFHLDDNLKKYYESGFGYPKYKSKYDRYSYMTGAIYSSYKDKQYCNIEVDLVNRKIKLPKLKLINIRGYRNIKSINGKIVNATVSKEKNGKYYVSVIYDMVDVKNSDFIPRNIVGIDLGIKKLLTLSDGITCEKLRTKSMIMKKELSKSISDASFSEILRQLEYKSRYKNKLFYQIDRYYPSSQECSVCGNIDKSYKDLSKRKYKCSKCHNEIDRDVNASMNIVFEGLKLYMKEVRI